MDVFGNSKALKRSYQDTFRSLGQVHGCFQWEIKRLNYRVQELSPSYRYSCGHR